MMKLTLLALILIQTTLAIKYTSWPVQPIYNVKRDIPKDQTTLVFVYSCMCPRSQRTIPEFTKAAKELKNYYGIKTKSLEYYMTGFEFVKVLPFINRFPILMLYRADGSKIRYDGIDPPSASSDDFVRFTLDNEYAYNGDNENSVSSNTVW
ncbi:unnamed protein product, partial [Mesorhabditis belari]|uniref:Thioredoxin domain-containing protein n=1 Tax=Mesorhabditis belari TaxID=2138241 RepID=A0AAF3FCF7_9BILA